MVERRRAFAVLSALAVLGWIAAGCASDKSASQPTNTATTKTTGKTGLAPGKLVVVPASAQFSSGTSAASERWTYDSVDLWTLEIVSVDSKWVKVRRPSTAKTCYGRPATLEHVDLRFYVERSALLPVTTKRVVKKYDDETSVELQPGVVIEGADSDEPSARLDGFSAPVDVGRDAYGPAYDPSSAAVTEPPDGEWFRAGGGLAIDGERFERTRSHPLHVVDKSSAGDTSEAMFGRIVTRCGEVRAVFNAPVGAEPPTERRKEPDAKFQLTYVTAGSTVYWPDGDEAGTVGDEKWPLRVKTQKQEGRPCFAASFVTPAPDAYTPNRHFRICADPSDLETPEEVERRKAKSRVDRSGGGHVSVLNTAVEIRLRSLEGGHDWDAIKQPVASVQNEIEECYRNEVSPDDKFGGTLSLTLTIGANGDVQGVSRGDSSLGRDSVAGCVENHLKSASFPSGSRSSELGVEFVFSLEDK